MIYLSFGWAHVALLQVGVCFLSVYYFLRFIDERKNQYLIISSLFTIIGATLIQYLIIAFILLFLIVAIKYNSKRAYAGYGIYLLLFMLLNIFWAGNYILINKFFGVDYYKVNLQSAISPSLDPTNLLKQFTLIVSGVNQSISYFMNGISSLRMFLIVIFNGICLTGLFFIRKNRYIVIFALLSLGALQFMLAGDSLIYVFLFKNLPFFEMFRAIDKFFIYFNLALIILLAFSAKYFFERFRIQQSLKIILGVFLLLMALIISFPLASGNMNGLISPFKLPSYYSTFQKYEKQNLANKEGNIYVMPMPELFSQFSWINFKYQQVENPMISLTNSPIIYDEILNVNLNPLEQVLFKKVHKTFDLNSSGYFYTLAMLNIKAILLQNDQIKPNISKVPNKVVLGKMINSANPNIYTVKKFGKLTLMEVKEEYQLPVIYIPNHLVVSNVRLEETIDSVPKYSDNKIALFDYSDGNKLYTLFKFNRNNELEISNVATSATVLYIKSDQTKYEIYLRNVKGTIPLVFSQTFNQGWKLYINNSNDSIFGFLYPSINESDHMLVNGYANSWILPINDLCNHNGNCQKNNDGSYNLVLSLEFMPQRFFYIGEIVSGITFAGCVILAIYYWRKSRTIRK